jgi:AraC-like DNA-binding protein
MPAVIQSHDTNSIGARSREKIVNPDMCPALRDVRIGLCGISDARAGFTFVRHAPDFGQVLMTCDGEGRALVKGHWQTMRRGMAYVTPQGVPHAYHAIRGVPWRVCWAHYNEGPVPTTITCRAPSVLHVNPQPLHSALLGLYFEATGEADPDVMAHWVHLIHTNFVRLNDAWDQRHANWHIWEKVNADLGHPWTVAELAAMACMSGESFRLWCHKCHGHSPLEHVTFLRMRRATDVLRRSDQKLEVIARWLGYENVFAFSRAFKRWIGMPPAHFRHAAAYAHTAGEAANGGGRMRTYALPGERMTG